MADNEKTAEGEQSYGASDITVLEGLEAVRKRPGMYIGSTGERGLHHLVYEVVDNSVDEALAGYADHIEVTIQADGGIKVVDNGRGIPSTNTHRAQAHRRGRHDDPPRRRQVRRWRRYAVSGGLHGVGISVVNALSTRVNTEIRRQGYVWRMSFANGGTPITPLERGEATDETGTTQVFYPDPEIFETVEFDFETLRQRFQQMAFLNKGLRISLTDERESPPTKATRSPEARRPRTRRPRATAPSPTATSTACATTSNTSIPRRSPTRSTTRSSTSKPKTTKAP